MFHRMTPALAAVTTGCLFIGLIVGVPANAEDSADAGKSLKSCREEVWRVSVPTKGGGPKSTLLPRYQKRTVLVCDEKIFAEIQRQMPSEASDSRNNEGA
jgi:hypothetical protein